jgi:hypothetical protein
MAGNYRPHLNSATFAGDVVKESNKDIVIPVPLTADELQHYRGFYAYRRAVEWRHGELLVLAELSRVSVKIESLSLQLSKTNFEDNAILTAYERVCKVRDQLRRQVNLNIPAMAAKTMATQKLAANQIIDGLNGKLSSTSVLHPNTKQKIDWDKALNV